jgi:hypothetical protein
MNERWNIFGHDDCSEYVAHASQPQDFSAVAGAHQ